MEIKEDKLILLTEDGRFVEVDKNSNNVDIGEEISVSDNKIYNCNVKKFIAVAAMLLIIMTGGYGVYGYYNPYGYVNIDINPSVELTYNLYNRIINVEGINKDGEYIISKLGIDMQKNKKIEDVINKIIDEAVENGYMDEKENTVLITLTDEKKNIDGNELLKSVNNYIVEKIVNKKEIEVKVISNTNENYKISKDKNVSPGKMILIDKAINIDDSFTKEELYSKPINEIMNVIKSSKEEKNTRSHSYKKNKTNEDEINEKNDKKNNFPNNDKKVIDNNSKSENETNNDKIKNTDNKSKNDSNDKNNKDNKDNKDKNSKDNENGSNNNNKSNKNNKYNSNDNNKNKNLNKSNSNNGKK
nr:anti-sigma factor domain-containing protein [Anaeromonas gelatinilytica]